MPRPFSEPGISFQDHILPIVVASGSRENLQVVSFEGTGFVMSAGVLVTCWHCVAAQLPTGTRYAAVLSSPSLSQYRAALLSEITQHPLGIDLAVARIDHRPTSLLRLSGSPLNMGADVTSQGYPFSNFERKPDGSRTLMLNSRYLQGYVTRSFLDADRGFGPTEAYELDMPTPEGLSGAPLIKMGSLDVVGVIYGTSEVSQIKHFERIDDRGQREPEVVRVVTFGLAHNTSSLHSLKGPATNNLPLIEFLR
jgi:hypothetical protein